MQTTNLSISEILRRAKEKSITIPQFQRQFVWTEGQVKLLVDSISRNYPIGSILLLTKSQTISLVSRSIEAAIRDGFPPDDVIKNINDHIEILPGDQYYVLDGQQRLTSIVRVFMNAHPKKTYYFDIREMIKSYNEESTEWIITRVRGKNDKDRKENNRLVRSDVVLDQSKADIFVAEYIEDSGDFPEYKNDKASARKAAANVKGVFEKLRNYQVPVVTIERDAQIESVCRIFETINSTGTRLTTYDLAVARFYPEPDLRSMWDEARERYNVFKDFEVDGERVLQVIALIVSYKANKYAEVTRGALLDLTPSNINMEWQRAVESLANSYMWAKQNGARAPFLPSHGLLPAIAAIKALGMGQNKIHSNYEAILCKWYFCKVLQQGARQATNYKIARDFQDLTNLYFKDVIPQFEQIRLNNAAVVNLYRSTDVRYRGLQSIIMQSVKNDLFTGISLDGATVEEHHLFPKSLIKGNKRELIDSIANKIPILKSSNSALSDTPPSQYFSDQKEINKKNGTMGQFKERIKSYLIPGDPDNDNWIQQFDINNYENFIYERASLILNRLHSIVGDEIVDPSKISSNSDSDD